jgi:uncharacterized protein (DUF1330 family)
MKTFALVELTVTDPAWIASYTPEVTRLVEAHGGRYLARTSQVERLEGEDAAPQVVVLLEFPSREALMGFYESEDYRPHLEARLAGSKSRGLLFAGEDFARPEES